MILNFMPGPENAPGEGGQGGQGMDPEQGGESPAPPPEAPQEEAPEAAVERPAETKGEAKPTEVEKGQFGKAAWDRASREAFTSHESAMMAEVLPKAAETAKRLGEKAMMMAAGLIGLRLERKTETAPGGEKEATGKVLRAFSLASFKLGGYEIFVAPFAGVDHNPKNPINQRPIESLGLTRDDLVQFEAEHAPSWRRRRAA